MPTVHELSAKNPYGDYFQGKRVAMVTGSIDNPYI
jgi:hypothetical protein